MSVEQLLCLLCLLNLHNYKVSKVILKTGLFSYKESDFLSCNILYFMVLTHLVCLPPILLLKAEVLRALGQRKIGASNFYDFICLYMLN